MTRAGRPGLRVGVVGATGMVGRVLLDLLERRYLPVATLLPYSSGKANRAVRFRGRSIPAPAPTVSSLRSADLVIMVSSDEVSKRFSRDLAERGVWVIDDSSAFRQEPDVPLVIPEVNARVLSPRRKLVAGPNCTVTGVAVAGYPLHRRARAKTVRVASYQAVSGAGRAALLEFYDQVRRGSKALKPGVVLPRMPKASAKAFPKPIGFNLFPHVGSFDRWGDSGEETKVRNELRKLWGDKRLRVSSTTVRVPVIRGHSLAVWMETSKRLTPGAARSLLKTAPGVKLWKGSSYPTAYSTAETDPVHVGRIRESGSAPNELSLWILSDNLLKGAALNSVHIAKHLLKKGWLRSR